MRPEPSNWDEALNENNFHEIVNDDADMYEQIEAIPADDDNMVNSTMTIVRNHISEVWSPPRVTEFASEYGLSPSFSYASSPAHPRLTIYSSAHRLLRPGLGSDRRLAELYATQALLLYCFALALCQCCLLQS